MPIFLSYEDTAFLNDNTEWVLKIPVKEGAVLKLEQVERIVTFCRKMLGKRVSHKESELYIDASYWEMERINFFRSVIGNLAIDKVNKP